MNWIEIIKLFDYNQNNPLLFHTGFFLFIYSMILIIYAFVFDHFKLRKIIIVLFSIYFYYKASGKYVILLLLTISADYIFSKLIVNHNNRVMRKIWLVCGILFSLSFLLYFKYSNFIIQNLSLIPGIKFNLTTSIVLPIGISFYTFQSISYLVDTYKNKIKVTKFLDYLMYMTFFPHLVAGPIVRALDFIPQIDKKNLINKYIINEAFYLILKGLVKKAIISDYISQYSDIVFSAPEGFSGTEHILSTLCYTLQIFCDFSGYTDMAIGIALLMGFRLSQNFNSPYKANNISNFWRNWHISLSSWLRDYIYIPMGGNKKGIKLQMLLILFTMIVGGLWHGADWKFIFWGFAHGLLIVFHKIFSIYFRNNFKGKCFSYISWILTFICVSLLWIPFRAESIEATWIIYSKIFFSSNLKILIELLKTNLFLFILIFIGYFFTLIPNSFKEIIKNKYYELDFFGKIASFVIVIQIIIQIRSSNVQPFIYFQF
jgi:D-alanyl-lipoteichoic acid acyltransferase DltB (MBOAT superfamily)